MNALADIHEQVPLPPPLSRVSEFVESRPEAFLQGDVAIQEAALEATRYVFDIALQHEKRARAPIVQLLRSIEPSTGPETRSQRKRKRSESPPPSSAPRTDEETWRLTPLESLYIQGMDDDQVWAQLELRASALCKILKAVLEDGEEEMKMKLDDGLGNPEKEDSEDLEDSESLNEDSESNEESEEDDEDGEDLEEEVTDLRDPSEEDSGDEDALDLDRPVRPSSSRKERRNMEGGIQDGHSILDDGFFSLAEFNQETEEAEAKNVSNSRLDEEDEDEGAEQDVVDLFTDISGVDAGIFEEDDLEEHGEPYYNDFFALPRGISKKSKQREFPSHRKGKVRFHDEVRVKKIKSRGKGNPLALLKNASPWENGEEDEESDEGSPEVEMVGDIDDDDDESDGSQEERGTSGDGHETIERLKDDLFAEDDETESRDISRNAARQKEIARQIEELEEQALAPKPWALLGEATSRSRPVNSLLEEDLEFERVMKVTPVVTEEVVSDLEELIKKRVLNNHFDDVVRKRPLDEKPFLPSRFFELDDQKSAQSLAQIYEDEYSAAANGRVSTDDRDGKLKKEHEELERMWDNICHKLDALSNAHFTPKQPKATISTVSNLPTTSLESTMPTTKKVTSVLAPEEIFSAPSNTRSHDELSPGEKRAQRNKKRKERRKMRDLLATSVDKYARTNKPRGSIGNVKKDKERALKTVVKTGRGVTVVGKGNANDKRHVRGKGQLATIDSGKLKL